MDEVHLHRVVLISGAYMGKKQLYVNKFFSPPLAECFNFKLVQQEVGIIALAKVHAESVCPEVRCGKMYMRKEDGLFIPDYFNETHTGSIVAVNVACSGNIEFVELHEEHVVIPARKKRSPVVGGRG